MRMSEAKGRVRVGQQSLKKKETIKRLLKKRGELQQAISECIPTGGNLEKRNKMRRCQKELKGVEGMLRIFGK